MRFSRFVAQTSTPSEAYARATTTPREIRRLAESLVIWSLANLRADSENALGNLPLRFGFRSVGNATDSNGQWYRIALTPAAEMFVTHDRLICSHPGGATALDAARFEPRHIGESVPAASLTERPRAEYPSKPVEWLLAWATLARAFQLLSRYETWALDALSPRLRIAQDRFRPKIARRSAVPILELPEALASMAEWCGDSERAMLAWIIRDAKDRGIEAVVPRI